MLNLKRAQQLQDILAGKEAAWRQWIIDMDEITSKEKKSIKEVIDHKLQENPEDPHALTLLAWFNSNNIELYKKASANGSISAMSYLAFLYRSSGQYPQAAEFLGQAIAWGSSWAKEIYSRDESRFSALFKEQIKLHTTTHEGTTNEQHDYYILKLVEFLLQKQPHATQLYYYKMRMHLQLNEGTEALKCYESFVPEEQMTADDFNELATACLSNDEAEKVYLLFYKAYLKGDEESLKTLHLMLRENTKDENNPIPRWDGNFLLTEDDNKRLAPLILTHHAQFNTEMFAQFLETQKPALNALIAESQLTFNDLTEIALKKDKLVRNVLVKKYCQEYWNEYFAMHLHHVTAYLIDLDDLNQILLFLHSLNPEQQQGLGLFILEQVQKNLHQEAMINSCDRWASNSFFFLYVSKEILFWSFEFFMTISDALYDKLYYNFDLSKFWSTAFTVFFMHCLAIPIAGLAATSLIPLALGLVPALIGLGFTMTNKLIASDLHQRNEEYGGAEKLSTLHANLVLRFFSPANTTTSQQTGEVQEETARSNDAYSDETLSFA